MQFKIQLLFIIIFFYTFSIFGQQFPKKPIDFKTLIQNSVGNSNENLNFEDLFESLGQLLIKPIDLNTATRNELASLYLLNDKQINSILNYRNKVGPFVSVYELQSIEGIDYTTFHNIISFLQIKENGLTGENIKKSLEESNQYLIFRNNQVLEQKKGFYTTSGEKPKYLGSPGSYYLRYKIFHQKDISAGFTFEKDDGESLGWNTKKKQFVADFNSFHFQVQNRGHWKNIVIGDYNLQIGQGLVLAAGFYLGKGSETVLTVRRNDLGIRPYSSVVEGGFLRGAAATYSIGQFDITALAARNWRSGNLVFDKKTKEEYVTSIDTDGYRRTTAEIDDKATLLEHNIGTNIKYHNIENTFEIGATILKTNFDKPLIKSNQPYNLYEFKGKSNTIASLNYSYIILNMNLFGETAHSSGGGIGTVNGMMASLSKKSDIAFVVRHYAKNFHSFYANGFGENSRNINETGAYLGYKFTPNRKWIYAISSDYFKFPYLKFGVDTPSKGYEVLGRITYNPSKTAQYYIQLRQQQKEDNLKIEGISKVKPYTRRNLILNYDNQINKTWKIGTRIQTSTYNYISQKLTKGFTIVQDASWEIEKVSLSGRIAFFNTDDYENRQYVYEQDVLFAFSFPAYNGKGLRHYLIAGYKANKNTQIQLKWARTDLFSADKISSGNEEIARPHKSEIKIQLKWDW